MADKPDDGAGQAGSGRSGGGDSGGGAYPNPHTDKKPGSDGYMGHGGQTEQPYHGTGQLGREKIGEDRNANSATRETGAGDDETDD